MRSRVQSPAPLQQKAAKRLPFIVCKKPFIVHTKTPSIVCKNANCCIQNTISKKINTTKYLYTTQKLCTFHILLIINTYFYTLQLLKILRAENKNSRSTNLKFTQHEFSFHAAQIPRATNNLYKKNTRITFMGGEASSSKPTGNRSIAHVKLGWHTHPS